MPQNANVANPDEVELMFPQNVPSKENLPKPPPPSQEKKPGLLKSIGDKFKKLTKKDVELKPTPKPPKEKTPKPLKPPKEKTPKPLKPPKEKPPKPPKEKKPIKKKKESLLTKLKKGRKGKKGKKGAPGGGAGGAEGGGGGGDDEEKGSFIDYFMIFFVPAVPENQEDATMLAKVIFAILNIIVLLFILVGLYLIYYCIFVGYPKFLFDLVTFNMKNVVNPDTIINDNNNTMLNNYFILRDSTPGLICVYDILKDNMNIDGSSMKNAFSQLDQIIVDFYSQYKYDEKYYKAFAEYYIFFDVVFPSDVKAINTANTNVDSMARVLGNPSATGPKTIPIVVGEEHHSVTNSQFYKLYIQYQIGLGNIKLEQDNASANNSPDSILWKIYQTDPQMLQYSTRVEINDLIQNKITPILHEIASSLSTNQLLSYLVLPSNNSDITNFAKDSNIFPNFTYLYAPSSDPNYVNFNKCNEYSWYMFEVINFIKNGDQSAFLSSQIQLPPDIASLTDSGANVFMCQYVNLPVSERSLAISRMNLNLSVDTIAFINKHPIFSHLYFSGNSGLYTNVMGLYIYLMTLNGSTSDQSTFIINLSNTGGDFKKFINATALWDLYLSSKENGGYLDDMVQFYESQHLDNHGFGLKLWMPFVKDMIFNRIGIAWKNWAINSFKQPRKKPHPPIPGDNSDYTQSLYMDKFFDVWNGVQETMKALMISSWKSMFTSSPIAQPAEPTGV